MTTYNEKKVRPAESGNSEAIHRMGVVEFQRFGRITVSTLENHDVTEHAQAADDASQPGCPARSTDRVHPSPPAARHARFHALQPACE